MEKTICRYVRNFSVERVPEEICRRAFITFFDTIGTALAGKGTEQAEQAAAGLEIRLDAGGKANGPVIWGYGHREAQLSDAVFINGVLAHSCEFNDLFYQRPGHPSAVLVPAVLGLGERLHKSGRSVLEAYICGMEILGRINEALLPEHHKRGFHSTSTAGILGAALACGKLLELDEEELENACSLACTFACGLRGNFGYTANSLHVGNAASSGLKAALWAGSGIRGRRDLLTMESGYLDALGGDRDVLKRGLDSLDQSWIWESPGILIKKYPVCYSAYQAIEAARKAAEENAFASKETERIECLTSPNHYMSLPMEWPDSIYGQRFCIPFCVCQVLSGGKINKKEMEIPYYRDPRLQKLKAMLCYGVEEAQKGSDGFGSTLLRIVRKNGSVWEYRAFPSKKERVEGWTTEELRRKWNQCLPGKASPGRPSFLETDAMRFMRIRDVAQWTEKRLADL